MVLKIEGKRKCLKSRGWGSLVVVASPGIAVVLSDIIVAIHGTCESYPGPTADCSVVFMVTFGTDSPVGIASTFCLVDEVAYRLAGQWNTIHSSVSSVAVAAFVAGSSSTLVFQ